MKIYDIKVNGVKDPIGFLYESLCVSWKVTDTDSTSQKNARIEVAADRDFNQILTVKEGENLNSSGEQLEVSLSPRTRYFIRITVSGDRGDKAVNDSAFFETGKMDEPWTAQWITTEKQDTYHPVFKKKFQLKKKVKNARYYGSGVGLFYLYVNGQQAGNEYLTPYITNYEDHIQVITFPVEELLHEGTNELAIYLGKGWYMGTFGLDGKKENFGNRMATIGELHLTYEDGTEEVIATDESFSYQGSSVKESGIYYGEDFYQTLYDDKENPLKPAVVLEHPEEDAGTENLRYDHLIDRLSLPVVHHETLPVKEVIITPSGDTVLDFGQNFAGWMVIKKQLPKGARVTFECAEILQDDEFYHENYRTARSQFIYKPDGKTVNAHPHFTYFGFRYLRVTGWPGIIDKYDVEGWAIYSDIERTGYIETSDEKINRLYENTLWSQRSNFIDMPTDCPQRSERLGWTGDAQVFAPTASYHYDTRAFFHKFEKDLRDEQKHTGGAVPNYLPNFGHDRTCAAVWGDIATLLPKTMYRFYGSMEDEKFNYPMMRDWVKYIHEQDVKRGEQDLWNFGFAFGDWLALDGKTATSFKGSTDDGYISSVYYYESAKLTAETADRIGKKDDAAKLTSLAEKIRKAILREYFTESGRCAIDTQAALIIALKFGVYVDRQRTIEQFKDRIKNDCNRIRCGFTGAPLMCSVMADCGMTETLYDFLLNEDFPGWLYEVNLGATTIWERWNSVGPDGKISPTGMNSLNHYAYGSVMETVYSYVAGIKEAEPGFRKALIAPHPDIRIPYVKAGYDSVNGCYALEYQIMSDGTLKVHIEIPFNCTALVELPGYKDSDMELTSGKYDYFYRPDTDFRKPYNQKTPMKRLAKDPAVMDILLKYVPPVAGLAQGALHGDPEAGAEDMESLSQAFYLGFDPEKMQQAIKEIEDLTVQENADV